MIDRHADNASETVGDDRGGRWPRGRVRVRRVRRRRPSSEVVARASGRTRTHREASSPRRASSTAPTCNPRTRCRSTTSSSCCSVNLVGTFAIIEHALPSLMEGGGSIVTIASTAAITWPRLRRGLHREQGRRRSAHPPARGAVRRARRAGELRVPGRCRHADDRRRVRDARSTGARRARAFRSVATRNPRRSATSSRSCSPTTRATSRARPFPSRAAPRSRDGRARFAAELVAAARRGARRVPSVPRPRCRCSRTAP